MNSATWQIKKSLPTSSNPASAHPQEQNQQLRQAIYAGDAFLLAPSTSSQTIAHEAKKILRETFPEIEDVRQAHQHFDPQEFFSRMGRIRKTLYLDSFFQNQVRNVIEELGFDLEQVSFDPLRLRVVSHKGHENPAAAPVYYAHRDTWYAHPQSLIVCWIPLDDIASDHTFEFYPDAFAQAVPNDSEIFDYAEWTRNGWSLKIGWQDAKAGLTARYPQMDRQFDGEEIEKTKQGEQTLFSNAVGFSCQQAERLLFAGAHLHRTKAHAAGFTRYSLDFRVVDRRDVTAGLGAPNVDNRSRGSCLADYTQGTQRKA